MVGQLTATGLLGRCYRCGRRVELIAGTPSWGYRNYTVQVPWNTAPPQTIRASAIEAFWRTTDPGGGTWSDRCHRTESGTALDGILDDLHQVDLSAVPINVLTAYLGAWTPS